VLKVNKINNAYLGELLEPKYLYKDNITNTRDLKVYNHQTNIIKNYNLYKILFTRTNKPNMWELFYLNNQDLDKLIKSNSTTKLK
jgi:hypothetical protein